MSGNHGRNNVENQSVVIDNITSSITPQQSVRGFIAPASVPVKKTPDIIDIIGEKEERRKEKEEKSVENEENFPVLQVSPVSENANFSEHWSTMFEQVFSAVPTIYNPLKDSLPEIEAQIIKVIVKNDIQKEHFEAKKREALEYLRIHYDEKIEDIVIETNERLEVKKIIYDTKDKLQNFKEQNKEFEDFVQILDLKIKE